MTLRLAFGTTLLATLAVAPTSADAQAFGDPLYGSHTLEAGFLPDPVRQPVMAGGAFDASSRGWTDAVSGEACRGMVNGGQPDYQLTYGGGAHLQIGARSSDDVTLVINAPDGSWRCTDDTYGLNPALTFEPGAAGVYDVWVGTYGDEIVEAEIVVTEYRGDEHLTGAPTSGPDIGDTLSTMPMGAFGTVQLEAGFLPDPHTVELTAGGDIDLSTIAEQLQTSAYGHIAFHPDFVVQYGGGSLLKIYADAAAGNDPVLLVRTPNGMFHFVDDSVGLDPVLDFENAAAGDYLIWVGTLTPGNFEVTVGVTELQSVGPTE